MASLCAMIWQWTTVRLEVWVMADPESAGLPRLVRGSVVTHRRRCGKPNCRCADGEALHESTVLSYSEGGRTRLLMLPADQVAAVRAATERYRIRRQRLEADGQAGPEMLVARFASGGRRGALPQWRPACLPTRSGPVTTSSRRWSAGWDTLRRPRCRRPSWRNGCRSSPGRCSASCSPTTWNCAPAMSPDALRPPTAKAAAKARHKLTTRLSKGEKRNRKRMAELGAVYDATPVTRSAADIFPANDTERQAAKDGPTATNKWLVASVVQDAATVIARVFDEADRRDPKHTRTWVAAVGFVEDPRDHGG